MARAGQKFKLECEVETKKSPVLVWYHNGKVLKEIKKFKVHTILLYNEWLIFLQSNVLYGNGLFFRFQKNIFVEKST